MSSQQKIRKLEFKTIFQSGFKIIPLSTALLLSYLAYIFIFSSSTTKEKQIMTQLSNISDMLKNISDNSNLKTNNKAFQFHNYKIKYNYDCYRDIKNQCFDIIIQAKNLCDFDDGCKGFNSNGCLCFSNKPFITEKDTYIYVKK